MQAGSDALQPRAAGDTRASYCHNDFGPVLKKSPHLGQHVNANKGATSLDLQSPVTCHLVMLDATEHTLAVPLGPPRAARLALRGDGVFHSDQHSLTAERTRPLTAQSLSTERQRRVDADATMAGRDGRMGIRRVRQRQSRARRPRSIFAYAGNLI